MKMRTVVALASAAGLALLAASCSSSDQNAANKGKLSMALTASGTTAAPASSGGVAADSTQGPKSATITISAAQARDDSGNWVDIGGTYPVEVDLVALQQNGQTYTLPPDLLPEGHYTAIQLTISGVNITLQDDTQIAITPPADGWLVLINVSFDVTAGQETTVMLNLHMDRSFHYVGGTFEFDPDVECDGVRHD
jgi:hypothetical protein